MANNPNLHITYNVYGGQNILAPNATAAYQSAQRSHSVIDLKPTPFAAIDLSDTCFDSLRASYVGFDDWFRKKAMAGEQAITYHEDGKLRDFLYLKEETEELTVYASSPICMIVGEFRIDDVLEATPNELWASTRSASGVTRSFFFRYFKGKKMAYAI